MSMSTGARKMNRTLKRVIPPIKLAVQFAVIDANSHNMSI